MSIEAKTSTDALLIVEALARTLELAPAEGLNPAWLERRDEAARDLHRLAKHQWPEGDRNFEAACAYAANEYAHEFLGSLFPLPVVQAALERRRPQ